MPYSNPLHERLHDSDDECSSKFAQTSFTNVNFEEDNDVEADASANIYINPQLAEPPSIEDTFYETEDDEALLTAANYNELDGNCQDPFPSPRLLENQRRRLASRFRSRTNDDRFNVMLVQLPDETCMLRCMTGTIIGTLGVIVLIIVLYCMRIRENTGLPMEMDEFDQPNPAADIMGLATGL